MGISDDIRPRKYKRISGHSSKVVIAAAKKEVDKEIVEELFTKQNSDDFFANTPIEKNGRKKSEKQLKGKIPKIEEKPTGKGLRWLYILIIILTVLLLAGLAVWQNYDTIKGFFDGSYKNKNDQSLNEILNTSDDTLKKYDSGESNQSSTDQQSTTNQNSTQTPTVDKSAINISVLNGSGIKNAAKAVAAKLSTDGYSIKNTSNARSFSYQQTYIYFKTGKDAEADLVKQTLSDRTVEVKNSDSIVGANYDIVVVVGKT